MIWSQDGDPSWRRDKTARDRTYDHYNLSPLCWPTCEELYLATAHEAADTVVQILCGQGITYGLGEASATRMPARFTLANVPYFARSKREDLERSQRRYRSA